MQKKRLGARLIGNNILVPSGVGSAVWNRLEKTDTEAARRHKPYVLKQYTKGRREITKKTSNQTGWLNYFFKGAKITWVWHLMWTVVWITTCVLGNPECYICVSTKMTRPLKRKSTTLSYHQQTTYNLICNRRVTLVLRCLDYKIFYDTLILLWSVSNLSYRFLFKAAASFYCQYLKT